MEELNNCSREELITIVLMMQGQLDTLNENIERLIEQVRIANSYRFGKHTETLDSIDGQLSFFDEAENCCNLSVPEPAAEEVLPSRRNHKKKGQRETDLKDFPEEILPPYQVSTEELDTFYGAGNWRRMKDETYKRLRHEPESWTVEVHTVEVYVGTGGDHQDEFLRGKRPKDLLRGSIVTPSLLASILNVKYVNSSALHRVEQEFQRNGVNISRQTMSNWIIRCAEKYFAPFVDRMKQELLSLPVTQSDETPTQVIGDSDRPNSKCYMWVHRSGEFYKERPVVIYEYQKGRDHEKPLEFYRNYKGVLVTDSLEQYHLLDKKLPGVTNANCWAHARRAFADAVKAADKKDPLSDETPTQVIGDSDRPNSKCYMWVHRSGEFYKERPVVIYEYQKGRDHEKPLEFYRNYKGVLVTDSLEQYHLLDKKLPGVTNANCWAHARRAFADAVKAADKKDPLSVKNSVAYQALQKIAEFYRIDTELKELPATDRLTQRQTRIKPLVEDFFAWAKQQAAECTVPPKSRTGQGLNFVIHQENYLKVFLTDGDIPIDNSASERAIRTFCIGKKNWMFHNTAKGAGASALVYSISETAKLNNLRPYYYFRHILTELPKYCDEKGNIDPAKLDQLMPWAEELPEECRKPRRS